ncbi:hypothetical protein EK0264_12735 [Epidermidibacterium keratini]|uniref:Uncharacterized protein n=1 Tax=Epidermidibacterium keratini TaxID=1891644 RepID=A0A7L4YPL4_9ACTN|nr:hypothetical protein [Epidermidibacterium keratini]QHC01070.1 hypothetical protein EK0264_12735 [Epidermidibacterium keratini]
MNEDWRSAYTALLAIVSALLLLVGFASGGSNEDFSTGYRYAGMFIFAGLVGILLAIHAMATRAPMKTRREIIYVDDDDDDE